MKISIIIPAYNVEQYIQTCIESVLQQSYRNIEVIIINDGSSDRTGEICNIYQKQDNRVKVIHKDNSGVSDSRNVGLNLSTGDYVCFIDSDDWIEQDYLNDVSKVLKEKKCLILFNGWVKDLEDGSTLQMYSTVPVLNLNEEEALQELFEQKLFGWGVYATFYKREVIQGCEFDSKIKFGEDFYFKYQLIKKAKEGLLYLPINKYHYVKRESSATNSYSVVKRADDLIVIKKVLKQESDKLHDMLYYREYIPRIVNYAIMGEVSNCIKDISVATQYRKEILKKSYRLFINKIVPTNTKIKILILLIPFRLRHIFENKYIHYCGVVCGEES